MGRLLALRFAKLGSTLILWDVNTEGNEETARMVKELGAKVYSYTCDLSQRNKVYDAAEKVSCSQSEWAARLFNFFSGNTDKLNICA